MTPICPHTLNTRTVVLSAEDEIRIELIEGRHDRADACVSCDGAMSINLTAGDVVDIRKAEGVTKFIKMSREGFLEVLGRKLRA